LRRLRRWLVLDDTRPDVQLDFLNARAIVIGDKHKNGDTISGHTGNDLAALTPTSVAG
jgi:hypothetical protein